MDERGQVVDFEGAPPDERKRRSRLALVLVVLLLLMLCAIATAVRVLTEVTPPQRRFVERNAECLKCHTEMLDDLTKASVHQPFLIKDCVSCHTPHGKIRTTITTGGRTVSWRSTRSFLRWLPLKLVLAVYDSASGATSTQSGGTQSQDTTMVVDTESHLTASEDKLCWTCHGDLGGKLQMAHTHAPFAKGYCTSCHNPHASDYRVLLNQDERNLCITCHPIGPELARRQVHPPVASRYCTTCHDPHASDYQGILVDDQRDLCFECHPTVAVLSRKSVQHAPFLNADCTGCHQPHGSDYSPLLNKSQPELCYDCHPGISKDFLKPSHHPVDRVKLACGDCHDPHGADYSALLDAKDNSFCYDCHAQAQGESRAIESTYERTKHSQVLCISCHTPHGSYVSPLLRKGNPALCLTCHTSYAGDNDHPATQRFYDVNAQRPLNCTSSCHDPHGTGFVSMTKLHVGWGVDGLCTECHPDVGKQF